MILKMKNVMFYLIPTFVVGFGFSVSLTWDIPVDNQIGMFILTCLMLTLLVSLIVYDIKEYLKKKKEMYINKKH
jgi:hypothetical protein